MKVLYTLQGTTPPKTATRRASGGQSASSRDVDRDGAGEVIIGEPFTTNGSTYVYSGRTGRPLYRFDGAVAGAAQGYAIADAGDVNGDHVTDIVTPRPATGRVTPMSTRAAPARLIHDLDGREPGDFFGSAVSSAGDVDRDHRADIVVGAERNAEVALNAGRAYVFSGRTGELIRELHVGDQATCSAPRSTGRKTSTATTSRPASSALAAAASSGRATGRATSMSSPARTGALLFEIPAVASCVDLG